MTFNSFMGADGLIDDLSLLLKFATINLEERRRGEKNVSRDVA